MSFKSGCHGNGLMGMYDRLIYARVMLGSRTQPFSYPKFTLSIKVNSGLDFNTFTLVHHIYLKMLKSN